MKKFATLFILLLSSFSLYSQVIIKERLEIQPKLKIPLQATSTPDQTTTWVDIYYYYHLYYYPYTPWPGMGGLTRLELSTGQVDTIALNARFPGKTVWMVRSPTIGPVPLSTTAEVKNYNGPEYNYGISPPYNTTSIQYQPVVPPTQGDLITTNVYRSINYPNGSGPYELHGTIRYRPIPKPTVSITGTKIKQYTISSQTTTFPIASYTCSTTPAGKYAPTTTWSPQQTFNTQNYLNQIKPGDTLRTPVQVTATNIAGSASDTTGKLILIRANDLHHIKVFVTPDSINYGDSAIVSVKGYRSDSTDITSTLPGNSIINFSLDKPELAGINYTTATLDEVLAGKVKVIGQPTNAPPPPPTTTAKNGGLDGLKGLVGSSAANSNVTSTPTVILTANWLKKIAQALFKVDGEKFEPCNNPSQFSITENYVMGANCDEGGYTRLQLPDETQNMLQLVLCLDQQRNCVKYEIADVYANIGVFICANSGKTKVDNVNQVTDKNMAIAVVKEYEKQMKDIEKVIKRYQKANEFDPAKKLTDAEKSIPMNNYVSLEGIALHELTHATEYKAGIARIIDTVKTELQITNPCMPTTLAQNITQQQLKDKERDVDMTLRGKIGPFDTDTKLWNANEIIAHEKEKKYLENLVKAIKTKFNL